MKRFSPLLLVLALACPVFAQQAPVPAAARPAVSGGRLELYLEALDAQGWQWFFIVDTVKRRLPGAEFVVSPLVMKNADGTFAAKRGEPELAESVRLAVLAKFYRGKMLNYLSARSLLPSADGWRDAAVFAGINPDELQERTVSGGQAALAEAYKASSSAKVTETALFLDGKPYTGSQRLMPLYKAVNVALPAAKRAAPPAGYKPQPPAPPPPFWVVLSSGIEKSDALVGVFDKYFEGIKPVYLDHGSAERAAKFPFIAFAPSYIIPATPETKARLENEIKAGIFKETAGYLVYEDRQRGGFLASREEKKNTLEVFVMSQCPFGVLAENSLLEAVKGKVLPEGLKLEIHYIGDAKDDGKGGWDFNSLHGPVEAEENARQLFVAKTFPDKFYAYLTERNKEITSPDWQKAAKAAGIDADKVAAGKEEGRKLLALDFASSGELGMTTSPSFVLNGKRFMIGLGELTKVPGFEKIPAPGQPAAGCAK